MPRAPADALPSHVLTAAPPLSPHRAQGLLARVLEAAGDAAPEGVVVFDLDSTLLDNRPRQAAILRAYGEAAGLEELCASVPEHWDGWDHRAAMARAGLPEAAIREHAAAYKAFWLERFFTSALCELDRPVPGAAAYARAAAATGSRVVYLTGRPEEMREGTERALAASGFPAAGGEEAARLWMKPAASEGDDAYKARMHADLARLGRVVAAFDNEPSHINDYREAFPGAHCVHLATDHSPRPIRVARGIPSIRDFSAFPANAAPSR